MMPVPYTAAEIARIVQGGACLAWCHSGCSVLEVEQQLRCCLVQAAIGLSSSSSLCGSRSLVCRDYRGLGRSRGSLLFNSSSRGGSSLSRCSLFLYGSLQLRSSGGHHAVSVLLRGVLGSK